jgi:hypothetical protein
VRAKLTVYFGNVQGRSSGEAFQAQRARGEHIRDGSHDGVTVLTVVDESVLDFSLTRPFPSRWTTVCFTQASQMPRRTRAYSIT